jgi:hypothetical protein
LTERAKLQPAHPAACSFAVSAQDWLTQNSELDTTANTAEPQQNQYFARKISAINTLATESPPKPMILKIQVGKTGGGGA